MDHHRLPPRPGGDHADLLPAQPPLQNPVPVPDGHGALRGGHGPVRRGAPVRPAHRGPPHPGGRHRHRPAPHVQRRPQAGAPRPPRHHDGGGHPHHGHRAGGGPVAGRLPHRGPRLAVHLPHPAALPARGPAAGRADHPRGARARARPLRAGAVRRARGRVHLLRPGDERRLDGRFRQCAGARPDRVRRGARRRLLRPVPALSRAPAAHRRVRGPHLRPVDPLRRPRPGDRPGPGLPHPLLRAGRRGRGVLRRRLPPACPGASWAPA